MVHLASAPGASIPMACARLLPAAPPQTAPSCVVHGQALAQAVAAVPPHDSNPSSLHTRLSDRLPDVILLRLSGRIVRSVKSRDFGEDRAGAGQQQADGHHPDRRRARRDAERRAGAAAQIGVLLPLVAAGGRIVAARRRFRGLARSLLDLAAALHRRAGGWCAGPARSARRTLGSCVKSSRTKANSGKNVYMPPIKNITLTGQGQTQLICQYKKH